MSRDATHLATDVLALAMALGLSIRFATSPMWPTAAALALAVVLVLGLRTLAMRAQASELAEMRALVEKAAKDAGEAHRAMGAMLEMQRKKGSF